MPRAPWALWPGAEFAGGPLSPPPEPLISSTGPLSPPPPSPESPARREEDWYEEDRGGLLVLEDLLYFSLGIRLT